MKQRLSDGNVERAIGYTPCVCGVLDGTWHARCYRGLSPEQVGAGYKKAFEKARRHVKKQAVADALAAIQRAA